jgi:xanthine dehydrogenase accessory factor
MAFVDALFDGFARLQGILARRAEVAADLGHMLLDRNAMPVTDTSLPEVLAAVWPEVLVDARMHKTLTPEDQRGLAALVVGLGPNFEAGSNADLAVETARGEFLGTVITSGRTQPLAGEPVLLAGLGRERFVYSPAAGAFDTGHAIGDRVIKGQEIGRVGDTVLLAPLGGVLRALAHSSAEVDVGAKVVEVTPIDSGAKVFGLGERPCAIAAGVLAAFREAAI